MNALSRPKTPWHLWVLGIVGLIWFAGGANDYVQTKLENAGYLQMMADSVGVSLQTILDYYGNFPLWANVMWALGVWGSIAGGLLLLLRSKFAFHCFIVSLIGLLGTTIYTYTSDMPPELNTTFSLVFTIIIWVTVAGYAYYSHRMTQAGVLR